MEVILIAALENKDFLKGALIQQLEVKNNSLLLKEI